MLPRPIRKIHHALLPAFASLGLKSLCRLAQNKLDKKLEPYLDIEQGIFIEAGANDGLRQSNTYYFEAIRGWRGLLIEPIPSLASQCKENRPSSTVVNAALVAPNRNSPTIQIENAGLMSAIPSAYENAYYSAEAVETGRALQHIRDQSTFKVPATTLSQLIEAAELPRIDLLSLDVEGYEIEALKGLDLQRHRPRFMCIEVRDEAGILEVIGEHYRVEAVLHVSSAHKDILYKSKSPESCES